MGVSNGAGVDMTLVCKKSPELVGDMVQIYMEITLGMMNTCLGFMTLL